MNASLTTMSKRCQSSTKVSFIRFINQCARMTGSVSATSYWWIFKILKLLISRISGISLINKVLHIFDGLEELSVFLLKISHCCETLICVFPHSLYIAMCETYFTLEISLHNLIVDLMHPVGSAILLDKTWITSHWKGDARGLSVSDKRSFWVTIFVEIWIGLSISNRTLQLIREIFHYFRASLDSKHQVMVFLANLCHFIFLLPYLSLIFFDLVNQPLLDFLFIPMVIAAFPYRKRWFKCSQRFLLRSSLKDVRKGFVQFLSETKLVWRSMLLLLLLLFKRYMLIKNVVLVLRLGDERMVREVLVWFQSCLNALV